MGIALPQELEEMSVHENYLYKHFHIHPPDVLLLRHSWKYRPRYVTVSTVSLFREEGDSGGQNNKRMTE